jgi:hypothetical protein
LDKEQRKHEHGQQPKNGDAQHSAPPTLTTGVDDGDIVRILTSGFHEVNNCRLQTATDIQPLEMTPWRP